MDAPGALGDVLVVEDTPASLKLLSDLLQGAGYRVRQAPDGELALWSAGLQRPDLILLDIRMPGIDGFEVCRRLKAAPALCDVPVIFLSAQSDTEDKVRGFQAGAIDFIGKPYQAEEVLARTAAQVALTRSRRALAARNLELKGALEQLDTTRGELRRAEHLAALGAMVAGVAHELNTPIGNCLLAASTLEERVRAFADAAEGNVRRSELSAFVADARCASVLLQRNLASAAALIASFREVASGQDCAVRSSFRLSQLVDDVLAGLSPQLRAAAIAVERQIAPGIELDSFAGPLAQVLGQLVGNALRHGFAHGQGGRLCIRAECRAERVLLAVENNGSGIAPADLARVFEPFFTTRLGQGSSGLGLYIGHNMVVNVLGGAIAARSGPGATCFELDLPRVAPTVARALPGHPSC